MKLVIVLVLLVVGSLVFHWWSPWWFTPLASNWSTVDFTVDVTLVITAIVFVAVNLFMAYAVYRFRRRLTPDGKEPPQVYGSKPIEIAWTVAPTLIVFILILVTTLALLESGDRVNFEVDILAKYIARALEAHGVKPS